MVIKTDTIITEWKVSSAEAFMKEFDIKDSLENWCCDEELIEHHLEQDKRIFRLTFMENDRGNAYAEYWLIQQVQE